jgi:ketosteroid isomerase-like protein
MPSRERVQAFIATVVDDPVKAIADYYHEDASMQENLQAPRQGRAHLMTHEAKVLQRMKMHTHPNPLFLVDGDNVVIQWTFDATGKDGITRRLNELALQRWRGDRIVQERFVYDSASAWTVVETPWREP